nr:hypothetical protein [Roseomonas sp. SXEYE001]
MAQFSIKASCLVFLLDRAYLKGFAALLSSLSKTASLAGMPIVVISDDQSVLDEEFVRNVSEVRRLIPTDYLERYRGLPNDHIPEKQRCEVAPKYTWLKFFLFRDFGYDHNIYFDSDMLAFSSLDEFFTNLEGVVFDFAAAPNIPRDLWEKVKDSELFSSQLAAFLQARRPFRAQNFADYSVNFNSGFSIIGKNLMNDDFVGILFKRAAEGKTQYEQRLTYFALQECGAKFCELPMWINLTRPIYDLGRQFGIELVEKKTLVHHYIFDKPWAVSASSVARHSDRRWWEEYHAAKAVWPSIASFEV